MNKTELRGHLRQLRNNLSEAERHALSQQICQQLETIAWSNVHSVHCFEPIIRLGEVDLRDFVIFLQKQHPSIQLYTSRRINELWTIVSWQDHTVVETLQFDMVIVPMLGFDANLQRIGYGGGYYDRFLSTQQQARKIGVSFELGRVEHIAAEPHDVALDSIVTESQIYAAPDH